MSRNIRRFLSFIRQIISKEDRDNLWWQARKEGAGEMAPAGLIPAPRLQEWRVATSRLNKMDKGQREQGEMRGFKDFSLFLLLNIGVYS